MTKQSKNSNGIKILYILDDFPPAKMSSAASLVLDMALELINRGHEIFVITSVQDKKLVGVDDYQGIKVYRLYVADYHIRWQAWKSLCHKPAKRQVKKIIKEIKPAVVHFHHIHRYLSYCLLKVAKKFAPKVYLTAHDCMMFNYGKLVSYIDHDQKNIPTEFNYKVSGWQLFKTYKRRYNPFRNIIIRHYLKYVDKIFAVSYSLKQALNQNKIKNVKVIYNYIDLDSWQKNESKVNEFKKEYKLSDKRVVIFGGRLGPLKGGELIMKAMSQVVRKIPQAVLLVVGTETAYTQKLKKQFKNQLEIVFTGWLDKKELQTAYFSSAVAVTPSICLDTFNLMNIEAMAAGLPVVGTCFGGTPEVVVTGQTGYIVNPLNVDFMAEKITELLKDPSLAEKMGQAGKARVRKEFLLNDKVDEVMKWYEK